MTGAKSSRLFGWDIDRNCVEFPEAPYNDAGEEVELYDGTSLADGAVVNLERPPRAALTDFLYSPLLLLFVSARVRDCLSRHFVPNVKVHDLVLRDHRGRVVHDSYSWLNVCLRTPLFDMGRSRVARSQVAGGGLRRVEKVVVDPTLVPPDELFICAEVSMPIFSNSLVTELADMGITGASFTPLESLTWPVQTLAR